MKILHIVPHLGGGVGNVICDWMEKVGPEDPVVCCLDYINKKATAMLNNSRIEWFDNLSDRLIIKLDMLMGLFDIDIVLVHWWDHPMLEELIKTEFPACRLIFWCHKNYNIPTNIIQYPDLCIGTSLIQNMPDGYIWSTVNMDKFINNYPTEHNRFNIGYVGTADYKKLHTNFVPMCQEIHRRIPNSKFTIVGDYNLPEDLAKSPDFDFMNFVGKKDDVKCYYTNMDVFGYPLRSDHYGTCEQVIGEAMASGLPVVCMDNPCERTIIEEGVAGFLCKDEQEYIDNIEHLYYKPELRNFMGKNSRQAAVGIYNIKNMITAWDATFKDIMQKPKKERKPVI